MVASQLRPLILSVALFCFLWSLVTSAAYAQSYTAVLVGGRKDTNRFGDLLNYYIYAEEDAVVSPNPAYAIYRNGQLFSIYEPIVVNTPKEKKSFYVNSSVTRTRTTSRSISPQYRRDSTMTWTVISWPEGAVSVSGTRTIIAESNNQFTIRDWVFDYRGRYNVQFDVSLWNGDSFRFNRTLTVDPQASVVSLKTTPAGYNGSYLFPMPEVQLENLISQAIKSSTAVITFVIVSGPAGGNNTGDAVYQTDADGACSLDNVILSLPGDYVFRIDAKLSSGRVLSTRSYSLHVEKALPTRIEMLTSPYGMSQFLLFTMPVFRVYDQVGLVQDDRTNITLVISSNNPTFSYENQLAYATLMGASSKKPVNYRYTFTDLWLDMPGSYGIDAILMLDGAEYMAYTFYLTVASPPTYLIPAPMQINTIGDITITGSYPTQAVAHPIYFAISKDSNCASVDSNLVLWNETRSGITERNISIVPYAHGDALYLCMKTNTQTYFSKLIQTYMQRFTEAFPYVDSFPAAGVSECQPLSTAMSNMYRSVGWEAAEGRRYGCRLDPPVAGTVAPCTCPSTMRCQACKSDLFTPPGLDIGQCVCCADWVMGVTGVASTLAIACVLAVIYFYV